MSFWHSRFAFFSAIAVMMTALATSPQAQSSRNIVASGPTGPVGATAAAQVKYVFPLSKFVATAGPLRLKDATSGSRISIPLSSRLKLTSMQVNIVFTNSIALHAPTSSLAVRFNEATLAQIRLEPNNPTGTAKINVPVDLTRKGFNNLSLDVVQHNGNSCEDPEAPELWTEINTAESSVEITGEYGVGPYTLADLGNIFAPGVGAARRLVIASPAQPTVKSLSAGALVAQAAGLRSLYEPVKITHVALGEGAPADWQLDDHAIVGTRDAIAGVLDAAEAAKIEGPYVSLRALDRRQVQIVVSGKTEDDVVTAARALTYMDLPITDASSATIRDIDAKGLEARHIKPEHIYTFDALGLPTTTVQGSSVQEIDVNIPVAADLYALEQAKAELLLDLNYGAAFGPGSVINISLNGKFQHSISLTNEAGAAYRGYRISLPMRDFVGGANKLSFAVFMRTPLLDKCAGVSGRYLTTTLFGSSTIEFPDAARVTSQPDLDLFARTGFPYVMPDTPATIWMQDASLMSSAWTLSARLAQVSGVSLPQLNFAIGGTAPAGAAILLADTKALPPKALEAAKQQFGAVNRVPYGAFSTIEGAPSPTMAEEAVAFVNGKAHATKTASPTTGAVNQTNTLGRNALMTAARAANGTGTTTIITADTRERVISAVDQLVQPQFWGQAKGDFMLWQDTPDSVVTLNLSPRFQVGEAPGLMGVRFYFSQHPWWWLGGTVVVLIGLACLTVFILARRRSQQK